MSLPFLDAPLLLEIVIDVGVVAESPLLEESFFIFSLIELDTFELLLAALEDDDFPLLGESSFLLNTLIFDLRLLFIDIILCFRLLEEGIKAFELNST